jgi:iron(III) transport system permease protein
MRGSMRKRGRRSREIIGNLRLICKEPLLLVSILAIFYFLLIFVISPIYMVIKTSLVVDKQFDLSNYLAIFSKRYYFQPFLNSMILGICAASTGTLLGFAFAYAITRTPIPFKRLFRLTATFPIISPPFVVALAAILLFGRSGSLTPILKKIIGEYSIYGLGGLVLVETIAYGPIAFLVLYGILQAIDPALEEAAMDLGASRAKVFSTVTLPLAISGDFRVLSVQAFLQITGMYDISRGSTLAILLLTPTVTAFFLQKYWVSRKSYVTVTGRPTAAAIRGLEWYIKLPAYAICLLFAGIIFLFYGMVIYGSFQKLWGVDATLTLNNYVEMFQVGKDYIFDSLSLSTLATPITGILGMFIAFLVIRKKFIGRGLMDPFVLTGTAWIITTLLIFRNMPVGIRSGIAALQQIDPSIEEASTDLGANSNKTFRKITLPMIAPAFFSGLAFSFVKAMTAISAIIFVVSGRWNLITVAILGFVDNSQYAQAAAMSLLLIAIVLVALGVIQAMVGRIGKGARTVSIVD